MEIWKDVKGYEGRYRISSYGNVYSEISKRLLKQNINNCGYKRVRLTDASGKNKLHNVHRLVSLAFIPNPKNRPQVNHIDGVKTNNRLLNLEWVTHGGNMKHAYELGLNSIENHIGISNGRSVLSEKEVKEIRKLASNGKTHKALSEKYGVGKTTIHLIVSRKSWKHIS